MTKERVIKDVPDNMVDEVINSFESQGCNAQKIRQVNKKWTVRAICPDLQAGEPEAFPDEPSAPIIDEG